MMVQFTSPNLRTQHTTPAPAGSHGLPILRPKPRSSYTRQSEALSSRGNYIIDSSSVWCDEEHLTHVVGGQGRRGILPSAPGLPTAPAAGSGVKNKVIPFKDANGRFPCVYCTKTYLHVKYLKRHVLRHTGDRPYMCILCRDTFTRSDVLKRHFQKCSIRRGNPTGASHLSQHHAYTKKYDHAQDTADNSQRGNLNYINVQYQLNNPIVFGSFSTTLDEDPHIGVNGDRRPTPGPATDAFQFEGINMNLDHLAGYNMTQQYYISVFAGLN